MTMQVIISSILYGVQKAIIERKANADPLASINTDWENEARLLLADLPVNNNIDLAGYLTNVKGYDQNDLSLAGTAIAAMEPGSTLYINLAAGDDMSAFTGGTSADQDIVSHIQRGFNPPTTANQGAPMTAQTTPTPTPSGTVIDPNLEKAVNALLSQASGNKLTSISAILSEKDNLSDALTKARADLTTALIKANQPHIPTTGTTQVATGTLTFDVVNRPAKDVFPVVNGKKAGSGMDFEIPTLVWKDDQGNVVVHPEVPDVDDNYDFELTKLLKYLISINGGMNSWLFGHTGTGKSTFVEQIAARMGWPVTRINLDSNLERADLVGHTTLTESNGTTVSSYEEGILPRAMQRPGFLLMDEMDAGRPDILFVVQRALEGKGLLLTEDGGRLVKPHPLFRFAATANTRGQGDEYGMYAGTRTMNASMIDRFTAFIEFNYMAPDREADLLTKLVPSLAHDMAQKMAAFAKEVRSAFSKGEVYNTISPRGLSVLATSYVTFSGIMPNSSTAFQMAMDISVLDKVTNDTRQKFIELASRVFNLQMK